MLAATAAVFIAAAPDPSALLPGAEISELAPGHHHHHSSHHKSGGDGSPKTASFEDDRPAPVGVAPAAKGETASPQWTCSETGGCWPLLYTIGTQKGATTSLFKALETANIICGATFFPERSDFYKEAHYFDRDSNFDHHTQKALAPVTYTKLFKQGGKCPGNNFMDATPNYGFMVKVLPRLQLNLPAKVLAAAKLFFIVREPISRDISYYNMLRGDWAGRTVKSNNLNGGNVAKTYCKDASFSFPSYQEGSKCMIEQYHAECEKKEYGNLTKGTAWDRCGGGNDLGIHNRLTDGFYAPQLKNYLSVFSRKQIMVINFDSLIGPQQHAIIQNVAAFTGATPHNSRRLHKMPDANHADSFAGKVTSIDCKTHTALTKIFSTWNEKLFTLMAEGGGPAEEPAWVDFVTPGCSASEQVADK